MGNKQTTFTEEQLEAFQVMMLQGKDGAEQNRTDGGRQDISPVADWLSLSLFVSVGLTDVVKADPPLTPSLSLFAGLHLLHAERDPAVSHSPAVSKGPACVPVDQFYVFICTFCFSREKLEQLHTQILHLHVMLFLLRVDTHTVCPCVSLCLRVCVSVSLPVCPL